MSVRVCLLNSSQVLNLDYLIVEDPSKPVSDSGSKFSVKWSKSRSVLNGAFMKIDSVAHQVCYQSAAKLGTAQRAIANNLLCLRWNEIALKNDGDFININDKKWADVMTKLIEKGSNLNEDIAASLYQYAQYQTNVEERLRFSFPNLEANSFLSLKDDPKCIDEEDEAIVTGQEPSTSGIKKPFKQSEIKIIPFQE